MADAAMEQSDKNGDGVLDAAELAAAPGLKAAAEAEGGGADVNADGKLSRDEIRDRIAYYEDRATGYEIASIEVFVGQQPLGGATVELVPESFLSGVLESATGTTGELVYVSPRTGRAVSRAAGEPYDERLLALPRFMIRSGESGPPGAEDIRAGFRLTGYFLARHVYEPRGLAPPDARARFIALLDGESGPGGRWGTEAA